MSPFNPFLIGIVLCGAAIWVVMGLSSWGLKITRPGEWFKGKDPQQ